jgi:hypothetical protein
MRFWGGKRRRTADRVERRRLQVRCSCSKRLLDLEVTLRARGAVFALERAGAYPDSVTCTRCAATWEVGPIRLWDLAATTTVHSRRTLSIDSVGVGGSTSRMIRPVVQPVVQPVEQPLKRPRLAPSGASAVHLSNSTEPAEVAVSTSRTRNELVIWRRPAGHVQGAP